MNLPACAEVQHEPFPHTSVAKLIGTELANETLQWMENPGVWTLRIASFYEQWEAHLRADTLPAALAPLVADATIAWLEQTMLRPLTQERLRLSEVTAHKLVAGQTIRIHNDYLEGQETHRLLIQLNRGWIDSQGGLLMLFGSEHPQDVRRAMRPLHCSGFAFAISPCSFHAVSTIHGGERYTLVYSFKTGPAT
jgi:2OG-Fe(II) oxygenase superfamily